MFNDPSGEFLGIPALVSAIIIASIVASYSSYTVAVSITGKYQGQKRSDYERYLIHKEVSDILLNRTLTFGTRDALKELHSKYGWKYK